jgi:hypothetical protein
MDPTRAAVVLARHAGIDEKTGQLAADGDSGPRQLVISSDFYCVFQTEPPACYRASWQLPGPEFHRQATTSLRTRRSTMALRHGVTSCSAGRTNH